MKLWKYSLWLSIFSCILLFIVFYLTPEYNVFIWRQFRLDAGILFAVLLLSWTTALFGFALNNVFIDKALTDKNIKMPANIKCLPSILGVPSFLSFIWFIYRYYKGNPHH